MDPLDRDYLTVLVAKRDATSSVRVSHYLQGRIDEYCRQNAIVESDWAGPGELLLLSSPVGRLVEAEIAAELAASVA